MSSGDKEFDFLGVDTVVWREETLRSVYTGILDDGATELELARLHGLEGAKKKRLAMLEASSDDTIETVWERRASWASIAWVVCYIGIAWRCGCLKTTAFFLKFKWIPFCFAQTPLPLTGYRYIDHNIMFAVGFLSVLIILMFLTVVAIRFWRKHPILVCLCGFLCFGLQIGFMYH